MMRWDIKHVYKMHACMQLENLVNQMCFGHKALRFAIWENTLICLMSANQ